MDKIKTSKHLKLKDKLNNVQTILPPISAFFGDSLHALNYYVLGVYSKKIVINPEASFLGLYRACRFIEQLVKNKKIYVLFLNSNPEFSKIVKNNAIFCNQYYINTKWVGGTLTNWKQISQSIEAFNLFYSKWGSIAKKDISFPSLEKYKKCFAGFLDQNKKLSKTGMKDGISNFYKKKPDLLIIVDPLSQQVAIKEAQSQNIPVIALVNSDFSNDITYPIIGNNQNQFFVAFSIGWIARVLKKN